MKRKIFTTENALALAFAIMMAVAMVAVLVMQ